MPLYLLSCVAENLRFQRQGFVRTRQRASGVACRGPSFYTWPSWPHTPHPPLDPTRGYGSPNRNLDPDKSRMSMDDVKNGQRINCNGVHGTVIGKRSTRNQRFVLAKMDNGFTLKLKADTLSVELPETLRQRREENFSDPAVAGTSITAIGSEAVS